jgi:Tfp pilus assembly protein PilF
MAHVVRELPVLTGKAARDFQKQAAKATESMSKEEAQKSFRKTVAFMKEQGFLHPNYTWKP